MSTHLVEITPASVSSGSGNLVVHPHFPEEVPLQFPRLHCQLVIQNTSRDVINELEILVELILGMRVSLCDYVDGADNIMVRAVARRPGWESLSHFWAALVEHSFHCLH